MSSDTSSAINNWDSKWNTQVSVINKELLKENQPKYFGMYLLDDLKLANYLKKDGTVNGDNIILMLKNRLRWRLVNKLIQVSLVPKLKDLVQVALKQFMLLLKVHYLSQLTKNHNIL